jgi:hypothetical protein
MIWKTIRIDALINSQIEISFIWSLYLSQMSFAFNLPDFLPDFLRCKG